MFKHELRMKWNLDVYITKKFIIFKLNEEVVSLT